MRFLRLALILSLIPTFVFSQSFGKNKVQYKNFTWYYIQSDHFDVYFYEGGKEIAEFTAEVAESAYVQLKRDFRYEIRERIVFIIYKSHNDWQQTNVVIEYLEEGIGGVTELFKNRIVVPFEGDYEQFRHVIHHELVHAVMNDLLYGGSIQSLIRGEVVPVPIWFAEGLAEFESQGWNTRLDMIVRDATLNGYMPPMKYLEYFLVYQGGASVFKYIAETYGREKIGELINKSRGKMGFERVLRTSLGLSYEEFTERWHRYLRKLYWPDVANRKEPVEISKRLTNHKKLRNYLNVSPTISPTGDKIAFISDRKGYQNIYLMSAIDGKIIKTLIKGQRSESFEELHFLRPGMSFSPDGQKLVFSAKSGPWDAIYVVDIKSGNVQKHLVKLDGVFTTSWSPVDNRIAFVGNKDGQSDIYIYDLDTRSLTQITNDIFTDDQPSWSPDGKMLAFVSDRKDYFSSEDIPPDFRISQFDYEKKDVYTIDLSSRKMKRITATPWEEVTPIFSSEGDKLLFTSDKNGIFNIFIHDLKTGEEYPITNIISGIFQINMDRSGSKLVYTSFYNGGFDIYIMNNPLKKEMVELEDTQFMKKMRAKELPVFARNWKPKRLKKEKVPSKVQGGTPENYSRYVFNKYRSKPKRKTPEEVTLSPEQYKEQTGSYKVRRYKLKFSPDIVTGTTGYNTFFGLQGYTTLAFSDLLGDHKIYLNINLLSDLRNSDLNLLYLYLKRRINYGFGGYHLVYFFLNSGLGLVRYRNFGGQFLMSYPFNKFNRLDFFGIWYNVYLEYLDLPIPTEKVTTVLPTLSYVHDTVLWGYTGPVDGSRYELRATLSPKYNKNGRDFRTLQLDYRKYFMLNRDYQFAFRFAGGASFGRNAQQFFLGGIDNWINRKFRGGRRIQRIDDVFFSEFVTPLRGAFYYDRIGTRYFLSNIEFRFPLIKYLALGFPPISFFNIRGVMFYDIGSAWYGSNFRGTTVDRYGNRVFKDIVSGFGTGARLYFLYFLVRIDVAWNYDLNKTSKPLWYISLGADF